MIPKSLFPFCILSFTLRSPCPIKEIRIIIYTESSRYGCFWTNHPWSLQALLRVRWTCHYHVLTSTCLFFFHSSSAHNCTVDNFPSRLSWETWLVDGGQTQLQLGRLQYNVHLVLLKRGPWYNADMTYSIFWHFYSPPPPSVIKYYHDSTPSPLFTSRLPILRNRGPNPLLKPSSIFWFILKLDKIHYFDFNIL